jgi:uncharacterized protein YjbI with pentapeptide repeats
MTKTLPELLCSDAWWQDVGPALSPDGRALVKENLTQASAKLDDKEKEKFTEALTALGAPSAEQLAWLRDVAAVPNLADLSNILICHPDTGAPINLENHQLPAVTFKGAVFAGKANFWKARFEGKANFTEVTFTGQVYFWEARFMGEANFGLATFAGEPNFWEARFMDEARFEGATFKGDAIFFKATFTGQANFQNATFTGQAFFWVATFTGQAIFLMATFAGEGYFRQATFRDEASFQHARFKREANFRQAMFTGEADFEGARFTGEANFKHTEFLGMTIFGEAHFKQVATFHAARFGKTVSFRGSNWGAVPDFIGTAWKDGVAIADFEQLQTNLNNGTLDWRTPSTSDPTPLTDRLQALRKMARDADDRPRELDYFALELQARYQGKERGAWLKRCLVGLYGCLSDYGRGVFLPLRGLVELCLLSMLCYWVLADRGWRVWDNALLLSLLNALPPLGASSAVRESSLEALYGSDIPNLVHVIAVGEGVIGLILLFLIALGLRNRFRL